MIKSLLLPFQPKKALEVAFRARFGYLPGAAILSPAFRGLAGIINSGKKWANRKSQSTPGLLYKLITGSHYSVGQFITEVHIRQSQYKTKSTAQLQVLLSPSGDGPTDDTISHR